MIESSLPFSLSNPRPSAADEGWIATSAALRSFSSMCAIHRVPNAKGEGGNSPTFFLIVSLLAVEYRKGVVL